MNFIIFSLTVIFSISSCVYAETKIVSKTLSDILQSQSFKFPAQVINTKTTTLSSEISGVVNVTAFELGSIIKANQKLISISCNDHQISKKQASATLNRLNIQKKLTLEQLKRARKLVKIKSISTQELDQKRTALNVDNALIIEQKARLSLIESTISKCKIEAPFEAVVTNKIVNENEFVTIGTPLLTLMSPNHVELETKLTQQTVAQMMNADRLWFKQNQHLYSLKIRVALPIIDQMSKLQTVLLTFVNIDSLPLTHSLGQVTWNSPSEYIPSQYIVQRNSTLGVYLKQQGKPIFFPIRNALEGQDALSTFPVNSLIITENLNSL